MPVSTGPAIRGVCRVVNQNSCGSGSICGHYNGGSLVLTNAHVAGTTIGRKVRVEVESLGMKKFTAEVIRAAYSTQVIADWALLFIPDFQDIAPVFLSKNPPADDESLYTKGFPKCNPHNGTDITQHRRLSNGVQLWTPDAIGGQSGSGVWGDADHLQKCLLTWSWGDGRRMYGAGQLTSEIYRQNRSAEVRGFPMMPGLNPLPGDFDLPPDRAGLTDPVVEDGFYSVPMPRNIQDFPIWAEDQQPPPPDDDGDADAIRKRAIEAIRRIRDLSDKEIKAFENTISSPVDPQKPGAIDDLFGLGPS